MTTEPVKRPGFWSRTKGLAVTIVVIPVVIIGFLTLLIVCASPPITSTTEPLTLDQAYITSASKIALTTSSAMRGIQTLCSSPQILDSTWRANVKAQTSIIHTKFYEAQKLVAGDELGWVHEYFMRGMEHCDNSATWLDKGVDSWNAAYINQAGKEMNASVEDFNRSTELLNEYWAKKGIKP